MFREMNVISPQEVSPPNSSDSIITPPPPLPDSPPIDLHPPKPSIEPTPEPPPFEADVNFALALKINASPRMNRSGDGNIVVHNRKQACEFSKIMTLFTARRWGSDDIKLTYEDRKRIKKAACMLMSYDYGFIKPYSPS